MEGLDIAHTHLFFSFELGNELFSCALVHHFSKSFGRPDPDNGMWTIEPDIDDDGYRVMSVVHVDSIIRAAHLLPVFSGDAPIPRSINFSHTLNIFKAFYVNMYIDYPALRLWFSVVHPYFTDFLNLIFKLYSPIILSFVQNKQSTK